MRLSARRPRLRPAALLLSATCFAAVTAAVLSSQVQAATLLALSLPELVSASDQVVVARAVAQSSRYREGGDRVIVTDVELRVVESLKGSAKPGATLVVTHLGGAVGNLGLNVPGEARFPQDRSVIVFLERSPKSSDLHELHVVGMSQGVLPIVGDGQSAQVLPANGDGQLLSRDSEGKLRPGKQALTAPRPLRDLIAEIRRLAAEPRAR
jgi:hypothetical protein